MASPPSPPGSPRVFRGYTEEDLLTRKCIFSWDHPDIGIFTNFARAKNLYSRAWKPKEIDMTLLRKALKLEANNPMAQTEIDVKILRKLRAVVLAGDQGEEGDAAVENDAVAASDQYKPAPLTVTSLPGPQEDGPSQPALSVSNVSQLPRRSVRIRDKDQVHTPGDPRPLAVSLEELCLANPEPNRSTRGTSLLSQVHPLDTQTPVAFETPSLQPSRRMPPVGAGVIELDYETNRLVPRTVMGTPQAPVAMQRFQAQDVEQGRAKVAEWENHKLLEKRGLQNKEAEFSSSQKERQRYLEAVEAENCRMEAELNKSDTVTTTDTDHEGDLRSTMPGTFDEPNNDKRTEARGTTLPSRRPLSPFTADSIFHLAPSEDHRPITPPTTPESSSQRKVLPVLTTAHEPTSPPLTPSTSRPVDFPSAPKASAPFPPSFSYTPRSLPPNPPPTTAENHAKEYADAIGRLNSKTVEAREEYLLLCDKLDLMMRRHRNLLRQPLEMPGLFRGPNDSLVRDV